MIATLQFDLSDPDDARNYEVHCQALNMYIVVWDFIHDDLRSLIKYDEKLTEEQKNTVEHVMELLMERIKDYRINLDL